MLGKLNPTPDPLKRWHFLAQDVVVSDIMKAKDKDGDGFLSPSELPGRRQDTHKSYALLLEKTGKFKMLNQYESIQHDILCFTNYGDVLSPTGHS